MTSVNEIDQFLLTAVERQDVPGVVGIVADKGQVLYHQAFGKLNTASRLRSPAGAMFRIMSMTKPITSVVAMTFREAGQLDLDDPVSRFLPRFKNPQVVAYFNETNSTYTTRPAEGEIAIRHLLNHTAGFGYAFSNHTARLLEQKSDKPIDQLPLLHDPGSRWTYGPNTRILGRVLERISGVSLEDLFRERVFKPLQMPDTSFYLAAEDQSRRVACHQRRGNSLAEIPLPQPFEPVTLGDGGLLSTATDYIRFLRMLLNGGNLDGSRVLSQDSIELMTQNQIGELLVELEPAAMPEAARSFPAGAGVDKFGLGFQITGFDTGNSIDQGKYHRFQGSYSWSGLMNTHFWVDPVKGIAAVFLTQLLPFYDPRCLRVYRGFEDLVYRHLV